MVTALRAPGRLLSLGVALVFAVVAVLLGDWQYSRHQERLADRELVERSYSADPVPLQDVLAGPGQDWSPDLEWTRVEVTGTYDAGGQLLARNRPYRQVAGYAVTVPLVVDQAGPVGVLVDRGWVANARDAATLPEVPPVPEGEVRVTGWLRPGEVDLGRDMPAGQLASINLADAQAHTGTELYDAYLVLDSETLTAGGATPVRPTRLDPPDTGLGSHFAYALQWWLTAPVGIVLVLVVARRDAREARVESGGIEARRPIPARKQRIWDDEDE